ncbi:MAG: phosphate ABC transporter permease PstA [Fimbriimonadales bacterium]|nr:phosphate ABC transporter permease PstA [Fimbriimonadales bacterium]MDW8051994.1 phosphate ABC transporter permease PstA [Armatimonadota bacterium]
MIRVESRPEWRMREYRREQLFQLVGALIVLFALTTLVVLLTTVLLDGYARLLDIKFFTNFPSRRAEEAGIKAALVGSAYLLLLTAAIAIPIGVGAAIYLEEFAKRNWFTRLVEINITNLAGVPSVIYGLLGLQVFVRTLHMDRSLLAGACTMALLALPVIITAAREGLRTVPNSLRYGSLALGATKWQTVRYTVLPVAMPSILTGVILALSRVIGETAPLLVIGAVVYIGTLPDSLFAPFTVLPVQIYNWTTRPQHAFQENAAAGIIVLLLLLLTINATAIYLRNRYQKRLPL